MLLTINKSLFINRKNAVPLFHYNYFRLAVQSFHHTDNRYNICSCLSNTLFLSISSTTCINYTNKFLATPYMWITLWSIRCSLFLFKKKLNIILRVEILINRKKSVQERYIRSSASLLHLDLRSTPVNNSSPPSITRTYIVHTHQKSDQILLNKQANNKATKQVRNNSLYLYSKLNETCNSLYRSVIIQNGQPIDINTSEIIRKRLL